MLMRIQTTYMLSHDIDLLITIIRMITWSCYRTRQNLILTACIARTSCNTTFRVTASCQRCICSQVIFLIIANDIGVLCADRIVNNNIVHLSLTLSVTNLCIAFIRSKICTTRAALMNLFREFQIALACIPLTIFDPWL